MPILPRLGRRARATLVHLLATACVAALVALLVFVVWYPSPYATGAGGVGLFTLLIGVDMVLGPALTAVVASAKKPLPELRRDIAVIVTVQLAALGYGLYAMAEARPVFIAFEVDRFRVVSAVDIASDTLEQAPAGLRTLPWTGPKLIAAIKPTAPDAQMRSIELGLAGIDLSMVPANWRAYADHEASVWRAARPVGGLMARYPQALAEADRIAASAGQSRDALRFLPVQSRRDSWVALLAAPGARIVGYLAVDGFF